MNVKKFQVGYLNTNCYLLEQKGMCIIIDPGDEVYKIEKQIGKNKLLAILVTHHHADHIGALEVLVKKYHIPVYDANTVKEQAYEIGPFSFEVIYTPGHSNDSVTFYFPHYHFMFVGDFIFKGTIGRMDLETGNRKWMQESIEKIKNYPDYIKCYPGHGENTTLGQEKENNYFFLNEIK